MYVLCVSRVTLDTTIFTTISTTTPIANVPFSAELTIALPVTITIIIVPSNSGSSPPSSIRPIQLGVGIGVGVPSFLVTLFGFLLAVHSRFEKRRRRKEQAERPQMSTEVNTTTENQVLSESVQGGIDSNVDVE